MNVAYLVSQMMSQYDQLELHVFFSGTLDHSPESSRFRR